MTRKDYILIANVISAEVAKGGPSPRLDSLAHRLATALENDNRRFNYGQFISACLLRPAAPR